MKLDFGCLDGKVLERADGVRLASRYLADLQSAWSIGGSGAIAEFHRDGETQPILGETDGTATAITTRGAIRVTLLPKATAIARERPAECGTGLLREVMFCLPDAESVVPGCGVLAELGPDANALRKQDRIGFLFDLGFDFPHVRACVRTSDPDCLNLLRTHLGRSVLEQDNPLLKELRSFSPHRVFYSALGRIEVYGKIPSPGESSPRGPHTHVLTGILRRARPAALQYGLPTNLRSCLCLYPAAESSAE